MKNKQNYYNIQKLLETNCGYNMLLGERANGKSYQVKYLMLWEAWHESDYLSFLQNGKMIKKDRYQFAYLRRWREEIKNKDMEKYFSDMPIEKITNGECNGIISYTNDIFFSRTEEDGTITKVKQIGSGFCLTGATHYKSLAFPKIGNIVFEEFITNGGYLPHEVDTLTDIVSTIARRNYVRIFLIGNTISRLCPYFDEWQLVNVKKQKQGTIDIYSQLTNQYDENNEPITVKIAVEYCENSGNNSKMFFGQNSKMVTSGVWESQEYPHLKKPFNSYECKYKIAYYYQSFAFCINLLKDKETREIFLYIYPLTKKTDIRRIVTDSPNFSNFTTLYLTVLTKYDSLVLDLINNNKVLYSDNLTGTEWNQIKKERGKF